MIDEDINNFVPSILNPRAVPKQSWEIALTQNSIVSRCSLSLKRNSSFLSVKKNPPKIFASKKLAVNLDKENNNNNNSEDKENEKNRKTEKDRDSEIDISEPHPANTITDTLNIVCKSKSIRNAEPPSQDKTTRKGGHLIFSQERPIENCSFGFSAIEDLRSSQNSKDCSPFSFVDPDVTELQNLQKPCENVKAESLITSSSADDLIGNLSHQSNCNSSSTISYNLIEKPSAVSISFGLVNCDKMQISTKNSSIKKFAVSCKDTATFHCDCVIVESSQTQTKSQFEEMEENNTKEIIPSPRKLDLEIETSLDATENYKVLILKTNAIEKLAYVICQPPNFKSVKRQIPDRKLINSGKKRRVSEQQNVRRDSRLKQTRLDRFFVNKCNVRPAFSAPERNLVNRPSEDGRVGEVMSRNILNPVRCERHRSGSSRDRKESDAVSPPPHRLRRLSPVKHQNVKIASSEAQRIQSAGSSVSHSRNIDSLHFNLPAHTRSTRSAVTPKAIPSYKIIAGTHIAVDAFSYGDIPNVKHYFLTHFHSDHYAGLKKSFNKLLFCSKITAELCVSRLGVNPKCIRVINCDETMKIDTIEVTSVDANHCPGALMLVFTLPCGKTLLHTGDFRASPQMESYPIFWNKDIHTVYLDTTYCNPRYDFPTQDQSLEMALYLLRQKKITLEKAGKKFSSVLIVCGTYTIGKEKFFLGMARRVGCSVWACPEKDRVLQAVEGRSFSHAPPHSCQLHVVPMRDLTHEKLHTYLMSLQGSFNEVVAFKPSGWENGKNTSTEKDGITIHGIPYSEHSSFSEMVRFVNFLKPKQVVPTVDISGGAKVVQKYFPCPLMCKDGPDNQSKISDYFGIQHPQRQSSAVT